MDALIEASVKTEAKAETEPEMVKNENSLKLQSNAIDDVIFGTGVHN